MTILLDTSVWVAALVANHPHHHVALRSVSSGHILLAANHLLAELFAVLTRLPTRPRITPAMARRLILDNVTSRCTMVALDDGDYLDALARLSDYDLAGGVIYDALHVRAAIIAEVDRLHTFNGADFRRVWPDAGERLVVLA